MHISRLVLNNVRCFEGDTSLAFSPQINLLVGPNNSGKSTVIWPLTLLQPQSGNHGDWANIGSARRLQASECNVTVEFNGTGLENYKAFGPAFSANNWPEFRFTSTSAGHHFRFTQKDIKRGQFNLNGNPPVFPRSEPNNLMHFFLSRRKVVEFKQTVNAETTSAVRQNFEHLHAKVAKLSLAHDPFHGIFNKYLKAVLGFELSTNMTTGGQQTSLFANGRAIPLETMGEGTANIVALLADLATASSKVFLIEEPENDIHPGALIGLLDVIKDKSATNQFIISTHSNIVVSRLGAIPESKIFSLEMTLKDGTPTTTVVDLPSTPSARFELMRSLGYELSDLSIVDGYLILEEASAEAIIREILIPFLVPHLIGKIRTHSSGGVGNVKKRYEALYSLFVFLHTAPVYQSRSWVRIDNGAPATEILEQLKTKFPDDKEFKFRAYSHSDFERYYPIEFQPKADRALAISDKVQRQEAKRLLCKEVLKWASENPDSAKAAFIKSANEIVLDLHEIAKRIV